MADLFDLYRERRSAATDQWSVNTKKLVPTQLTTGHWPLATDFGGAA
jgi:hypothetical protein